MRRRATTRIALIIATLIAIVAMVVAIGGLASASIPNAATPRLTDGTVTTVTEPRTAINRRTAFADAHGLLDEVRMPGAVRVDHEPRGDGGFLAHPASAPGTDALADVHRWWTSRATVALVIADIEALKPARASTGHSFGTFSGPGHSGQMIEFDWPARTGVLSSRAVVIEAVNLGDGMTGVRADAEDVWTVARPAGEQLPAGINRVTITSAVPDSTPIVTLDVTTLAQVAQIVSLIDSVQVAQPGWTSCPAEFAGAPVITMTFRGGAELAAATVRDDDGEPSSECSGEIDLTLGGAPQMPLAGNVIEPLQKLLGVNLDPTGLPKP